MRRVGARRRRGAVIVRTLAVLAVALAAATTAGAAAATPLDPINPISILEGAGSALPGEAGGLSTALDIVLLLTVLSLVPSFIILCTCFARFVIVLGLLRQAIGTQSVPPSQVIVGLSLFLTFVAMAPTATAVWERAIVPYNEGRFDDYSEAWEAARQPIREFMFAQIDATNNWSSVFLMLNYRGIDTSDPSQLTYGDVDMLSLVPAFILSELKTAFLIGFRIYLPFLVIDMVIASMLISMGMLMLPPVLISLPFKLLLFVLVDGWQLVVGSLLAGVAQPDLLPPDAMTWIPLALPPPDAAVVLLARAGP